MDKLIPTRVLVNIFHSLILVFFLFYSAGCSSGDGLSESFKIENEAAQNHLIEELQRRNIAIKVDGDHQVWFSAQDRDKVHAIAQDIMAVSPPDKISFHYVDEKYTDMLAQKLRDNNVPFEIEVVDGNKQLVLFQKDARLWKKLKAQVDELYKQDIRTKINP